MKLFATLLVSLFVIGVSLIGSASPAHAQMASPKTCLSLTMNVSYGMNDSHTDGDISRMQSFLADQGFFNRSFMGTLHFGPATRAAVIKYQAAHGISQTGFVGPLTRASISAVSCDSNPIPTPIPAPTPTPLPTPTPSPTPASSTVSLYSLSPTYGSSGTTLSITGFGFTQSNTVLMSGSLVARDVPITSSIAVACTTDPSCHGGIHQTLTVTVPSSLAPNCAAGTACPMYMRLLTPGSYQVTVVNDNGTSNALSFTVSKVNTLIY